MKRIKTLLVFSLLVLSVFLTACKNNNSSIPNIAFKNNFISIEKYYYIGDEIELNGQCIDYYSNIKNAEPTESDIAVTTDMILNFSTKRAGEFSFKLKYKDASVEINYYVYEKPETTQCFGFYTSANLDKNEVAEIKANQVVINCYEEGYTDFRESEPISTTTVDSKVKASKGGSPKITFVYEQQKYEFINFVNGVPTKLKRTNMDSEHYSTLTTACTKIG